MNVKWKFLLNLIVIAGIFLAFKPSQRTIDNYGLSVAIVALAATFFEIYIGDLRAASGDPKAKRDSFSLLIAVLALAGAGIAAVVVRACDKAMSRSKFNNSRRPPNARKPIKCSPIRRFSRE